MTEQWRLLQTGFDNAFLNMAVDQAILLENSKGNTPPTVRFYGWAPPAISIGYFQSLSDEVDITACERCGIDYVRRITGGGAVFHEKELTYSIVIPESHPEIPKNIMSSYRRICGAIIRGLQQLGIKSDYAPINDIVVGGQKISGNAQTRKVGTVLQHGTVLMDVDIDKMFSLLKVPNEKIKDKLIADVKQRVTSVKHLLGKDVGFAEVSRAMQEGFQQEFAVELVEGKLSENELVLAKKLQNECFSLKSWNYKR